MLERLSEKIRFDEDPGVGIAFQVDIEDAVGMVSQMSAIEKEIEDEL